MNRRKIAIVLVSCLVVALALSVYAQVNRPYRNGSAWDITFVRMKPGMETAYLSYLATTWKNVQEARKKEGLILSYKVLTTEGHSTGDFNIILMTEYKDLASMEASEDKDEALTQRVVGNDEKQRTGYRERAEIREIVGGRLAREIVLEPKRR